MFSVVLSVRLSEVTIHTTDCVDTGHYFCLLASQIKPDLIDLLQTKPVCHSQKLTTFPSINRCYYSAGGFTDTSYNNPRKRARYDLRGFIQND